MKNLLKTLILVLISVSAFAQDQEQKVTVGFHAGFSIVGSLVKNIADSNNGNSEENVDANATPALQLTADYSISKLFSLGVAVSHQIVSINTRDFIFNDPNNGMERIATFQTKFRRSQIALRPLFHYGNTENLDLYSGLRIGWLTRGFSEFEGEDAEGLSEEIFNTDSVINPLVGGRFSFSITAFGMRYFFNENIGAGFEINLGAPYIANVGLSARF